MTGLRGTLRKCDASFLSAERMTFQGKIPSRGKSIWKQKSGRIFQNNLEQCTPDWNCCQDLACSRTRGQRLSVSWGPKLGYRGVQGESPRTSQHYFKVNITAIWYRGVQRKSLRICLNYGIEGFKGSSPMDPYYSESHKPQRYSAWNSEAL